MKKTLLLLLFLFSVFLSVSSQERLSYEKVINCDSISKNYIYSNLKNWISTAYVSAKAVIEIDDKESGLLVLSANQIYSYGKLSYLCYDGFLDYTVKFQIKDGRYKLTITNFIHRVNIGNSQLCALGLITVDSEFNGKGALGSKPYNNKVWLDIKSKAELLYNNLLKDLGNLKYKQTSSNDDNW